MSVVERSDGEQPPVGRRGFLKYLLVAFSALVTVGGVAFPVLSYLWPPKVTGSGGAGRVAVADEGELPQGTGQVFSVANKPVIVVHTAEGFKALSAVCTHLGCVVYWDEGREAISCPCHEAYFTVNGAVISGPPPAPLPPLRVEVEQGKVWVEGGGT